MDRSVFCAGQIALVPCTMQLVKAGARTQTLLSLSHVKKVLQAVVSGSTLASIVQVHCYATRTRDICVIRDAWESSLRAEAEEKVSPLSAPSSVHKCVKYMLTVVAACFIIDAGEILIILAESHIE